MKIKLVVCIILAYIVPSYAQVPEVASPWLLSLDVIKAKAEQLVVINRQLTNEYDDLTSGLAKLRLSVDEIAAKNKAMSDFLAQRASRSDQQMEIEDISAKLNARKGEIALKQKQWDDLNKQVKDIERKVNIKKLRISDWEIRKKSKEIEIKFKQSMAEVAVPTDVEINALRKELETQKVKEADYEAKINELTKADSSQKLDIAAIEKGNNELQSQLDDLLKQIKLSDTLLNKMPIPVDKGYYNAMMARKKELETKIRVYEARIEAFKNPANFRLSWDKEKKQKIHAMVQADSRNEQLRSKINDIKEDILMLRDNVAKLERRINFEKSPQRSSR